MRVVSLSDHPGAMRWDAQRPSDREAQQAHESVLALHHERA